MEDIIAPIDRELLKSELTAERRLRSTNKSHNENLYRELEKCSQCTERRLPFA